MRLCAHEHAEHARLYMYFMPVALALCVVCRYHSIEQYAFHANSTHVLVCVHMCM